MVGLEVLLRFQRLTDRMRTLTDERDHLATQLAGNPELDAAAAALAEARERRVQAAGRLKAADEGNKALRERLRSHQEQLMSGRVRGSHELMAMSAEVDHLRAALRQAEDAELELMAELETAEAEVGEHEARLEQLRTRGDETGPALRGRIRALDGELAELEINRAGAWEAVPEDLRRLYAKVERLPNPLAEVREGQCQGCRVQLTAAEMQELRRGLRHTCQNCGRVLIL